ncbi:MAG: exo-alpha-sialidase, partial [Verrucomicrobiae bacterium]|nr:exo-alpha-sialidase [Verrucomicrobiae bacterium]
MPPLSQAEDSLIKSISKESLWRNRDGSGTTWFHPRPCLVPREQGRPPSVLMTMQEIAGSDYFGPVQWTRSEDLGATWSDPTPVAPLGRVPEPGIEGLERGVCDVVPQFHPATGTVLAMGWCVYYRGGKFARKDQLDRYPVYSVRDAKGNWGPARKLEWNGASPPPVY